MIIFSYPFLVPERPRKPCNLKILYEGGIAVVNIIENWHATNKKEQETATLEFCATDFYGPVVIFKLHRHEKGSIKAFPTLSRVENAGYSMSDLNILKRACKEIFHELGKFYLCIPLFEVYIDSEEAADTVIQEKLLNIRLF